MYKSAFFKNFILGKKYALKTWNKYTRRNLIKLSILKFQTQILPPPLPSEIPESAVNTDAS